MIRIGLLIPKTNLTVEYELQYLLLNNYFNIKDLAFYTFKLDYKTSYKENKIKYLEDIGKDSINKIEDMKYIGIEKAYFFCTTSAAIENNIVINNNPINSLIKIAKNRKMTKCLLITPYNNVLGDKVKKELNDSNIDVTRVLNLNLLHTDDYFEFGINDLKNFILENYKKSDGSIIISCTNLPTISIINDLEEQLETNIISSNSSMFEQIRDDILGGKND